MKTAAPRARLTLATLSTAAVLSGLALVAGARDSPAATSTSRSASVTFSGGHATDPHDEGRPDVLVAAGLGVPTAVFRKAFDGVTPAGAGQEPDPAQVQRNKAALLAVLAPYGVTNELLDTVSNYYRYDVSAGEVWRRSAASARAVVRNGRVVSVRIVKAGAGYSSTPHVTVAGYPKVKVPRDDLLRQGSQHERQRVEADDRHGLIAVSGRGGSGRALRARAARARARPRRARTRRASPVARLAVCAAAEVAPATAAPAGTAGAARGLGEGQPDPPAAARGRTAAAAALAVRRPVAEVAALARSDWPATAR